jgi:hypothetical protein
VLASELDAEKQRWSAHKAASAPQPPDTAPEVQRTLAGKNKEALEAIRQSLSNKLINPMPPSRVVESMRASGSCGSLDLLLLPNSNNANSSFADVAAPSAKPDAAKVNHSNENVSSSFEEARANLQDFLLSGRPPALAVAATKRQAPLPPPESVSELTEVDQVLPATKEANEEQEEGVAEDGHQENVSTPPESAAAQTPKLTPAIR